MAKKQYKTKKKYSCPYCGIRATRGDLVNHVGSQHEIELAQDYTPARAVYDSINKKDYGTCMICGDKVYVWNDKICRYNNLCEKESCRRKVREIAVGHNMKVYNKPHLLNDPEQQKKMLANRRISGKYTFQDGGVKTYTGSYEKKALEFWDKFMNIPSQDIECPGPILTYDYNGESLTWITDQFYIPAKLVIEVKDGGDNPNKREMESYREKQLAKEKMITDLGTFNYLRLTNNDFSQIMEALADIKLEEIESDKPSRKFHINEVGSLPGTMPRHGTNDMNVIIPYENMGNLAFAYSDDDATNNLLTLDGEDNKIIKNDPKKFFEEHQIDMQLIPTAGRSRREILQYISEHKDEPKSFLFFVEAVTGKKLSCFEQVFAENLFKYTSFEREKSLSNFQENAIVHEAIQTPFLEVNTDKTSEYVSVGRDDDGYFAFTPEDFHLVSPHYETLDAMPDSMIQMMNSLYKSNHKERGN